MKKFLKEKTAKDIMTTDVYSVRVNSPVKEIIKKFLNKNVMSLPVIDNEDKVAGIITERDITIRLEDIEMPASINILGSVIYLDNMDSFNETLKKKLGQLAADIMTTPPLTLNMNANVHEILEFMEKNSIYRVPIVDDSEKLVGIVTNTDIIKELIKEGKKL